MTSWIPTRTILTICCQNDSSKSRNRMQNYHRHTARKPQSRSRILTGRIVGSNRRRQIKEIPWRRPKGSIRLRIIGRPATFLMSGQISFTLFLWVPRLGAPNNHRQADLTIVETDT